MAYDVTQIYAIVNDAAEDAMGKNAGVTKLDTTDFVSLGKQLSSYGLLDGWFNALAKRISKTVIFARTYDAKRRSVLRDEMEWGAFIQKVYYKMPSAGANDTWVDKPVASGGDAGKYKQASPYDVETSLEVKSVIFGNKGTWSIEIVRPLIQIKNAFLNEQSMFAFIDGIYVTIDNALKLEEERLEALAVNTGMALAISRGNAINVLNLYNAAHDDAIITEDDALTNAEFIRVWSKAMGDNIEQMKNISTVYSPFEWETFTPDEKLVVEVLAQAASAADVYLQADTFHNELTKLPNYEKVSFWQSSGKKFAFADVSKIDIENDGLTESGVFEADRVTQGGILAYVHDIEAVACSFYDRRTWEMVNPRDEVLIHGDKAEKGYAVDGNANALVFYIENAGDITVTGDAGATLKYNHAYSGIANSITVTAGKTPSSSDVTLTQVGTSNTYTFTPSTNADITITCA